MPPGFASALDGFLAVAGWPGAVAAGLVVGLVAAVIIYAKTGGIFADRLTTTQTGTFQDRMLKAIDALQKSEADLRRENADLRDDVGRYITTVELLRVQQRRTIELLKALRDGRVAPSAIADIDLGSPA